MQLVQKMLKGDKLALAKCISIVENKRNDAKKIISAIHKHTGNAYIIGITGTAGCGKSTIVSKLTALLRKNRKKVGIIAVDPSSPFTAGAILGDRIRMQDLTGDEDVFIRSLATRGSLGGLSRATKDIVKILDAFGKDIVIVETVGVGQDEVDIVKVADTVVVVLVPGLGDDVQMIKAGILEIGDVFAINKSDRIGAEKVYAELEMLIDLDAVSREEIPHHGIACDKLEFVKINRNNEKWHPPIIKTIATEGKGIKELLDGIEFHKKYLKETKNFQVRRALKIGDELIEVLTEYLKESVLEKISKEELEKLIEEIANKKIDVYKTAEEIACRIT